jgi:hypothetical protein
MSSNENFQKLYDSVQEIMAQEATIAKKGNITYVKHTLRGYFNLLLLGRGEYLDMDGKSGPINIILGKFNEFVAAGSADEPTADEIDRFCEKIPEPELRETVGLHLRLSLKNLDKYRP